MESSFRYLQPSLGIGSSAPAGWKKLAAFPLLIFVGVMGTGKTTAVNKMQYYKNKFQVLPDRRKLTEQLIIAPLQREDGQPVQPLSRTERVPYIRRYKEDFPAGMAYAITQLYLNPVHCGDFILFDGLRGKKEVEYAANALPKAEFIFFDLRELVRAQRLLERSDPYDQIKTQRASPISERLSVADILEIEEVFSLEDAQLLFDFVDRKKITLEQLRNILKLILLERSLYDKEETKSALLACAPERTLVIDTEIHTKEEIGSKIRARLLEKKII